MHILPFHPSCGMREHETYTFTCTHTHKLQYCRVRTYVHTHMLLHKNALCVHAYIIHIYTRTSTNCCSRISFLLIPRVACVNMKHTHSHAHTHTNCSTAVCVHILYTYTHAQVRMYMDQGIGMEDEAIHLFVQMQYSGIISTTPFQFQCPGHWIWNGGVTYIHLV